MTYLITTKIEFDAGHRVPDHESKCRSPHGHRYKVEATVASKEVVTTGPETGMVADFSSVKTLLMTYVHDVLDHGSIIYAGDELMLGLYGRTSYFNDGGHTRELIDSTEATEFKVIVFPYVPTAENIARWIFEELEELVKKLRSTYHEVWLESVTVHETPNCRATYSGPYVDPRTATRFGG